MSEKVPAVRCVGVEFGYGAGTLLRIRGPGAGYG